MYSNYFDMIYLAGCGINMQAAEEKRIAGMELEAVYRLCSSHSLSAVCYKALELGGFTEGEILRRWREERDKAIRKNLLLGLTRQELCRFMEENCIAYMPLKGVIMQELYPAAGMRQMADNDILYDSRYRDKVRDWFISSGYSMECCAHHDEYLKAPIYNFEMHSSLFDDKNPENPELARLVQYYGNVWERLIPDSGSRYRCHFSDEDFYIYMLAHEYKHYIFAGTGLRSLLDCFVYNMHNPDMDRAYLDSELEKAGLLEFERDSRELAVAVFSEPYTFSAEQLTEGQMDMLNRHLFSGTYGNEEFFYDAMARRYSVDSKKPLSKLRYMAKRAFPDYPKMQQWCRARHIPFGESPILLPLAWAVRLASKLFSAPQKCMREMCYIIKK